MTNSIKLYSDFPELIDNTSRDAFLSCPTKWQRQVIQKLAPIHTSKDLHFGGAFAMGLETIRRSFYEQNLPQGESLFRGVVEATKFYGNYEPPENHAKNYETLIHGLYSYVERYPLATDYITPIALPSGKRAVEFTFAVPIPEVIHPQTGNPILYGGRFDMIGKFQNTIFGLDDKTTGQLGPSWSKQWDLNSQITGYSWAAGMSGFPLAGMLVRGQSILKNSFGFAEVVEYRPQWQIDRWLDQLVTDVKRMIEVWKKGHYDMNLASSCNSYGGCKFMTLCKSREPEKWLEGEYKNHFWNPLAKDPEAIPEGLK